jgi:NAD(P)-dependent dehydrogenase (short-subunit alcohol dehydrogenase family)
MARVPSDTVVLVTGAASGLGRASVEHLARRGYRVFGADRAEATIPGVTTILCDVDDDESVNRAVTSVVDRAGRLDVLVNDAGFGIAGSIDDTSIEEARAQMETNFFGMFRMTRAVLPVMRRQGAGLIVNVSSLGGLIALPFQGVYSAAKFAVEGLSEALRHEVRPFGIDVVLLEPADFRTGFTSSRRRVAAADDGSAYAAAFERAMVVIEEDELTGSDPAMVARLLERVIQTDRPRLRYTVGAFDERLAVWLKRVVPGKAIEPIVRRHYRVG